jgi:ankyrin repeat protein
VALELLKVDGVDVNIQDRGRYTALMWACSKGLAEVALELLKFDGVAVNNHGIGGDTALMWACSHCFIEVALELLKIDGVDVNYHGISGDTALMRACSKGLTEVVIELLKVDGVDVNYRGIGGVTALMQACSRCQDVVRELLKVDEIDVNYHVIGGDTVLMWSCNNGRADIALQLLRDYRVDRHIIRKNGSNALEFARLNGLTAVVTRFKALDRGDERMPLVKVHHRYLHGDVVAEGDQAQAPHPPESAITKTLVDKYLMHYISRFLAT